MYRNILVHFPCFSYNSRTFIFEGIANNTVCLELWMIFSKIILLTLSEEEEKTCLN